MIPSILLSLLTAALIGLINGLIVVKLRVPSFVATLGSFYVIQGIVLTTSHAYPAPIPEEAEGWTKPVPLSLTAIICIFQRYGLISRIFILLKTAFRVK